MKPHLDLCREFVCLVCFEHRWRTSAKPRKGWICPYLASKKQNEFCPALTHVYFRELDDELSWLNTDIEKNKRINEERTAREARDEKTVHKLNLLMPFFHAVEQGTKNVEMRLDDSHTRWIREGDLIEFICAEYPEKSITVEVNAKTLFVDFEEGFEIYSPRSLGFSHHSPEKICRYLRSLYDKRKILASHVVAFEFKVLKK